MTIPPSDYDLDSGLSGTGFRTETNTIIESILSSNASASLPPVTFPFMLRADTGASPNTWNLRNPSDNAFLKLAEVTDSAITLFSGGAAVPSLGAAQTFTDNQVVDKSGAAGSLSVGSDQSSGIVARFPMFGHNSSGANTTGVNLVCRITTNTAGVESFTFEIEVVRAGVATTVAVLGSESDFRRSGSGILQADTFRQGTTDLSQLLRENAGRFLDGGDFTSGFTPVQADEGKMYRFNGTTAQQITLRPLAKNTVIHFMNDSSNASNLTFASDSNPNNVTLKTTRLTLPGVSGQVPTCSVHWSNTGGVQVNIMGDNV